MSIEFSADQIAYINSLTKEQLKEKGFSLSTRKEKTPEQIEAKRQRDSHIEAMGSHNAQMPNATWICTEPSHCKKGVQPATYNLSVGYKHIIATECKATRLVSVDLHEKHGEDMFTRKHITRKFATENLDATVKFENARRAEKLQKELDALKA